MRDSFIIYRSFYDAISDLPKEEQADVYNAICLYSLDRNEPNLTGISATIFKLIKPQLEANYKRFENGKKAKQNQNRSKTEAKPKQKTSKTEANNNVNVNVNDNVNVNVNKNENKNEIEDILNFFNVTMETNFRSSKAWIDNFKKWSEIYSIDEIKQAIQKIPLDKFWKDKMTLEILFRQKNTAKENVDYIGYFLNQKTGLEKKLNQAQNLFEKWLNE